MQRTKPSITTGMVKDGPVLERLATTLQEQGTIRKKPK